MRNLFRCAVLVTILLASASANAQTTEQLQHDLDSLFSNTAFSNATFGIAIQSLKTGEYLYRRNDTKSLVPASNMKLFTTAEALALLGPSFRYKTELLTSGKIKKHTLYGDLIVKGVGDPSLGGDVLSYDLERITGTIVIDNSFFTSDYYPIGWEIEDIPYYYATPVSATSYNENQISLVVFPGDSIGAAPRVKYDELQCPYGVIQNLGTTGPDSSEQTIDAGRKNGTDTILITGNIPISERGGPDVILQTSIDDPVKYCILGIEEAVTPTGTIEVEHRRQTHNYLTNLLDVDSSLRLSELVQHMNKTSDNLYAECLFRTVAKKIGGEGSWTRGIAVMRNYLATIGIDTTHIQFTDGSGLSRMDLVTADDIVTLLRAMRNNPKLDSPFYNSLPIMGVDGTLENRLKGTLAQGNIHAKTGSMTGVRSISGYLTTHDGEPIAFSILANNYTCAGSEIGKLEDAVLLKLVDLSRK